MNEFFGRKPLNYLVRLDLGGNYSMEVISTWPGLPVKLMAVVMDNAHLAGESGEIRENSGMFFAITHDSQGTPITSIDQARQLASQHIAGLGRLARELGL